MTEIPEIRMAERCATCAFRPGTVASQQPTTQMKAKLCIQAAVPFLCHESPIDAMCAGVSDAMDKMQKSGEWDRMPEWRRKVLLACLEVIDDAEAGKIPDDDESVRTAMAAAMKSEGLFAEA